MKIAFFSESNFIGKIPRDFNNMRTEYAWYVALDATHHHIGSLPQIQEHYDLGIVIIPKTKIEQLSQSPLIEQMRKVCDKIAAMQEGPSWYFQDFPIEQQVWYHNTIMEMDMLFCHNELDKRYFEGITGKDVYTMQTLMIPDFVKESEEKLDAVIMGGNFCRWYGGFDSFSIAQEFNVPIHAVSMGRKKEREEELGITHLPYMLWLEWMTAVSQYKYAVHLMPTYAAGTFTMNCAYFGIPCIGYEGADTQRILHPNLSVKEGDLRKARKLAIKLRDDDVFYNQCSSSAKANFNLLYSEKAWLEKWSKYFGEV